MITEDERSQIAAAGVGPHDLAKLAVASAPEEDKKDVAKQAVNELSEQQRNELLATMFPQDSKDRMKVYIVGFLVAAMVALGLAAIAWGVSTDADNGDLAAAILVFASAFASAILGGLLGAYKG